MAHLNNSLTSSTIDDVVNTLNTDSFDYFDAYNNYTFSVSRKKGSTFIQPSLKQMNSVELKVGVLLPFHQNNDEKTRIMTKSGISAIRLAVAEINARNLIPGAYITLVEKDSYPKAVEGQAAITQAVFSAISLIQEGVVGVIGDISSSWTSLSALMTSTLQIPQCSFSAIATSLSDKSQFGYFFRTVPTNLLYSDAAIRFIISQGWPQVGILYSDDDFGQQLSENIVLKARLNGIQVKSYQSFYDNGPQSDIQKSLDTFMSTGAHIILVAAQGDAQTAVMTVAAHRGYMNNNNVWITMDTDAHTLYSAVQDYNSILEKRANHINVVPEQQNMTRALKSTIDPVTYAARAATDLNPIDYHASFSGGIFLLDILKNLTGYDPFDQFIDKWSHLDPTIYPFSGNTNLSSNEGLAYSCMMVMANGFHQTVYNSTLPYSNHTFLLNQLASGQLGQYLTPSAFNTSFVGPEGPMLFDQNGDAASSNFKLSNIQNGSQVEIGRIIAGNLNLTSLPIYFDGTTRVPTGVPDRVLLNPGYRSPVTITLLAIASLGTLIACLTMIIVLVFRRRPVFKVSSPLFCVLELIGFILTYMSVFFFVGYRTKLSCTMIPITFHLGYSLILGNLIAKNYRIYRIFNNVFITRTVVTDVQLLKVSGSILSITAICLISWFSTSTVSTINIPVSKSAYYTECAFDGTNHTVFVTLLTVFESFQLLFAAFLAFKTRLVGRNYSRYSEYKQIGLSVYNIFFSVLIGFIIFFVPATDYYTRHYLTATMIVWATTFSLLALFVPKLHAFFFPEKLPNKHAGKVSDLSGRQRYRLNNNSNSTNAIGVEDPNQQTTFSTPQFRFDDRSHELLSLNYMVNSSSYQLNDSRVRLNNISQKGQMNGMLMEAHEAKAPIQQVFKYFPYLAAWEMMHVVLMPSISYFSCFNEKSNKGKVFAYSGSSIMTNRPGEYILKVHGLGLTNVIMQVESEKDLNKWNDWFNGSLSYTTQAEECFLKQVHPKSIKDMDAAAATTTTTKFRLDSGITTQQVEDDYGEEDDDDDQTRRGSEMTVATFHCGYLSPKDVPLPAQQLEETDMSTADQGNSFYSSFAEYLSSVPSENSTVVATTPSP